jgi:hypothetical protein
MYKQYLALVKLATNRLPQGQITIEFLLNDTFFDVYNIRFLESMFKDVGNDINRNKRQLSKHMLGRYSQVRKFDQ